jgi:hypothetical protein
MDLQVDRGPATGGQARRAQYNKPIFGERDYGIHDDVVDLAPGGRNGNGRCVTGPSKVLAAYEPWGVCISSTPQAPPMKSPANAKQ